MDIKFATLILDMNSVLSLKITRYIWIPAIVLGLGSILLFIIEYQFMILDHNWSLYGGMIAIIFAVSGIFIGMNLKKDRKPASENSETEKRISLQPFENVPSETGLSKREFEILQLMASGMSNIEISEKLFLSVHTVKSHASTLFQKLDVKSRTQAILKGRFLGIIS